MKTHDITITANIMVKNEAIKIARCIESIVCFVDEIVIVDTGSNDNTIDVIRGLIKKYSSVRILLLFHDWIDDFSEIRNFMMNNSNGDIIFQIDADEYLENSDGLQQEKERITKLLKNENIVLSPTIININGSRYTTIPRIFKNSKDYFFYGNVHEELRNCNIDKLINYNIDLKLYHDGYQIDTIVNKSKLQRNIDLLNKVIKSEPNNLRWQYFWIRENYYIGENRRLLIDKAEQFIANKLDGEQYMFIYSILALCYMEVNAYEKANHLVFEMKKMGCMLDASFIELTSLLFRTKEVTKEVDNIIKEICCIDDLNSQINSRGDHVKVQLFRVLFLLARYEEAFNVLDEISFYTRKESIIPELTYLKQAIDYFLQKEEMEYVKKTVSEG